MSDSKISINEEACTLTMVCKKCQSEIVVKSGIVAGKQRFRCKKCGCNFRIGDNRTDEQVIAKKLLCALLHFTTDTSFRRIGKLAQTDHALVYRWIQEFNENWLKAPNAAEIKQMDFNELHQLIDRKKESPTSKLLTVVDSELWPGCSATIILHIPEDTKTMET